MSYVKEKEIYILDGAMGTELVKAGAPMGKVPEELNITHPDLIKKIHTSYLEAGSNIIYTNTFGANPYKCRDSRYTVTELVNAGVKIAKEAAGPYNARVALSMGPIGDIIEPFGNLKFDDAYEYYREMVTAGEKAGADVLVFETQTDLLEVKAGVLAARENTDLPIFVTMTFEAGGRTFTGTLVESAAITLEALGVSAVGVNCSLGPEELVPFVRRMMEVTDLPIIVKPNAGLPDPVTGEYGMDAEQFAGSMRAFLDMGVSYAGGCCGTAPDYIKALKGAVESHNTDFNTDGTADDTIRSKVPHSYLCSSRAFVDVTRVHVIGERINPTGKKIFKEALVNHDMDYIKNQALEQVDAGAEILDVNVGLPGIDEKAMMTETVKELQAVVSTPLNIDSSDPAVIEAALRIYNGKALVNSVNGEDSTMDAILPLVKKYGAAVIGLTMDSRGIPATWTERVNIAEHIVEKCKSYGIDPKDIYIDCLTLTVGTEQDKAMETVKALKAVKERFGVHTVLGVSNISFGLPRRELINTTFLTLAMQAGLDLPIINPNNASMMGAVDAYHVLANIDKSAGHYTEKYAGTVAETKVSARAADAGAKGGAPAYGQGAGDGSIPGVSADPASKIQASISKGLADSTGKAVRELLGTEEPLNIVNNVLIPALDLVGQNFEQGRIFLPQLLNSAQAAEAGFNVIKEFLSSNNKESISKGKIVLATVKGDVHDIGKNIVKTVLQNYGYTVIDLGKDVDPVRVVDTVREQDIRLVGLSALMTTTVKSMAETIKLLREAGLPCKIMVGGAVLTPEYAMEIGADFYAKDAKQSADIAKEVLG